ncbi:MAG: virulence RhuM family protein [Aeriscardovia sp.]|nr:virulence RhuM family protein [Aeriscardovia sp.]
MQSIESGNKGEIVMYQPDETIRLEVRMGEDTVWLSQAQMAELFGTKRQAITKHLQNIYESDELKKEATSSILELVRKEGDRTVKRKVEFYNLDAIISVGFRVNTKRGIEFRQWANRVLKDYMLRGYVVNSRIMALEQHVAEQDTQIKDLKNKVDFFVRSSLPPVEGIFYDGQIFDAYVQIVSLIKQAHSSIILVDNYIDSSTLTMLSNRAANVSATIYTRQLSQQQQLDVQRHNQQYPPITINVCQHNHDRFLIIDDVVYIFGASLKDAGKKLFAYIKMQETSASELLSRIR